MAGIGVVMQTGRSGMMAAKANIGTSGHNITNANTEGFTRQRVHQSANHGYPKPGNVSDVGRGVLVSRVERVNDEYLDKQIRNCFKSLSEFEEKDLALTQLEDVFNELNGDGINRVVANFFNEFRKLSNEPDSEAVREAVRESTNAMVNDFKRIYKEVDDIRKHIDTKVDGYAREINSTAVEIRDLNLKIKTLELSGGSPGDLLDRRDVLLKKLGSYFDTQVHKDRNGAVIVDIKGIGPFITSGETEQMIAETSPADNEGKYEGSVDLKTTASVSSVITHRLTGGKMGGLLNVRDKTLSMIMERLDDLAYGITEAVNTVHRQGFDRNGNTGINYFKQLDTKHRAAEYISLSEHIEDNVNHIAAAASPESPGDNRIATAIARIQNIRFLNGGNATADDWYNAMVSDTGVVAARNRSDLNQQKSIMAQFNRMRDSISGVSIDEETANLLLYQHAFDASAKVIQVADNMLKTILDLKR
ncbi:MAG: flagellar hook-associated protein FlgK [Xanthomonadaceae bacterium]|nr:flagellar hook-associated protein FlgK [Xanthomonadaceae bacterium]